MKGTRYCGKIHGNSIAKRLGSHLDCLFSRRDEFMSCSLMDGFQQRPRCMDIYRPHSACKAMAQLRVSTQQIKIKTGQALCIPRDTRPLGHTSTRLWRSFQETKNIQLQPVYIIIASIHYTNQHKKPCPSNTRPIHGIYALHASKTISRTINNCKAIY